MFGIGPMELVLILVVALLVFGPKRLPELARTLGRGLGEFRRASNDLRQSLALDDLQNDLRRDIQAGMSGSQTIHKPDEDRPAQAGDGLEAPQAGATDETGGPAEDEATGEHPGELPLGNDDEHHDVTEDPHEGEGEQAVGADSDESASSERAATGAAADSELGNVPISDSSPADPRRG